MWAFGKIYIQAVRAQEAEILLSSSVHSTKSFVYKVIHPFLRQGIFTSNGDKWRMRRKMLTPTVHFEILKNFSPIMARESESAVQRLASNVDDGEVIHNVSQLAGEYTLSAISESLMGVNVKEVQGAQEYRDNLSHLGDVIAHKFLRPPLRNEFVYKLLGLERRESELLKQMHGFSQRIVEKRREIFDQKRPDLSGSAEGGVKRRHALLDTLLINEKKGLIDAEGVQEEMDLFLWAGHETTSTSLSFTLMLLATHPEAQELLYQEIHEAVTENDGNPLSMSQLGDLDYLDRVIKESLRLYPPVASVSRELTEDAVFEGCGKIPKGQTVFLHLFDLHRDEEQFPEPERFDPDRFLRENVEKRSPFAYLPFSAGPRNCLGRKFAIQMMKTLLQKVLLEFQLNAVTKKEEIQLIFTHIIRPAEPIQVEFERRNTKHVSRARGIEAGHKDALTNHLTGLTSFDHRSDARTR